MKNIRRLLAVVFPLLTPALHAASIVVTNVNDSGAGSLRQALADAAALAGADEITFAPGLSGQSIALSGVQTAVGANALVISDAGGVTLDATALPGRLTLHDGAGTGYRCFRITSGSNLTLRGLTLSGFTAEAGNAGGAIFNNGTLTLTQCSLSGNSASYSGGAIYNTGPLTLTRCSLSGNSAGYGGAIIHHFGPLTLTRALSGSADGSHAERIVLSADKTGHVCTACFPGS